MNELPVLDLSECRTELIWANQRVLDDEDLHYHSSFVEVSVCWLIESGEVRLRTEEGEIRAGPGEWLIPGRTIAEQDFAPRSRIFSIRFLLNLPGGRPVFAREKTRKILSSEVPDLEITARELISRLQPWAGGDSLVVGRNRIPLDENFRIEAAFYQWLSAYVRFQYEEGERINRRGPVDDRVRQALVRLENFPFHEGFSESGLARECGLSVNQLNRLFKRETGLSPFQYADRLRLNRARQALSDTRLQVKEIAYELGFSSSPHFTNWFKQRQGESPRVYRNQSLDEV